MEALELTTLHPESREQLVERVQGEVRGGLGWWSGRRSDTAWSISCFSVDAAMFAAAIVLGEIGARSAGLPSAAIGWQMLFAALGLSLLALRGMYGRRLRLHVLEDLRTVVGVTALAAMAVLTVRVLLTDDRNLAVEAIRLWTFATLYVGAGRVALDRSRLRARRVGEEATPTLIIGAGKVGRLVARRLLEQPELGLRPVGFLDAEPLEGAEALGGLPVLGASWDLDRVVSEFEVEHVVVAFSTAPSEILLRLMQRCEELGIRVSFVPRLFERVTRRLTIEHLGGLPLISAERPDPKGWHFAVKYAVDRAVAALGLAMALPVLAVAALAVRVSLGRPIVFRQPRIGRDGRRFDILKFRSMKVTSPAAPAVPFLLPPDTAPGGVEGVDRRTRVGSFLRRTGIDELPQLLNVLKGEMSIVGPRPERPDFVGIFEERVHRYADRHRVKSGITGWAQVHGLRGRTSLSDRVEWDNYYIENWSLWLDVKILLMTVLAVGRHFRHVE